MIHLKSSGNIPKSFRDIKLYSIVTRETLYGFHRARSDIPVDPLCSKTVLLLSSERKIAEKVVEKMSIEHKYGYTWSRNVYDNIIFREKEILPSLMPLSVMSMDISDLQKLCWLHNFDMFIAHSINYSDDEMYIDGYEYKTWELPNRGITEKYMNDMLYKNN